MSDKFRESQLEHFKAFEGDEKKSEEQLIRIYANSLLDFKKYTGGLFEKYEDDGKLTYDEMLKYGRLDKMDETLKGLTVRLYSQSTKEISGLLNSTYKSGFDGTGEILSEALGKKSLIAVIKDEEMQRALTNEISGLKWTSRMGLHREHAVNKIRETIVKGLYEGESYAQMAKRLDDALGKDVPNSIGIVRTESYRVFSQARKDRLDRVKGADMTKEWVTSKDEVVRSNHSAMHKVKIPYNDDFILPNGNSGFGPGMIGAAEDDCNCRCFWVVDVLDADEKEGGVLIQSELSDKSESSFSDNQGDFNIDEVLEEMRSDTSAVQDKDVRLHYEYQLSDPKTFVADRKAASPLHYNPNDGKIHINPSHTNFAEYDISQVIAHEIGHKIDIEVVESFNNKKYLNAVQAAAEQVMGNKERYITLLRDDTIYNNMFTGDILSALSKGDLGGGFRHEQSYWDRVGMVETELFANMFAAEAVVDKTALNFLENEMPSLLEVFRKILRS